MKRVTQPLRNWLSRFQGAPASRPQRTRNRRCCLALESLEERQCLSVSVGIDPNDPSKLLITGDSADNFVSIKQDDAANALTVVVVGPNGFSQQYSSSQIKTIVAKMGGGSDKFKFDLIGEKYINDKAIKLDLGAGALDNAWFHLHEDATSSEMPVLQAKLDIQIGYLTGADLSGKDVVYLNMGNMDGGSLSCSAKLGAGEDEFYGAFWGRTMMGSCTATIDVNGGGDKDTLKVGGESFIFPNFTHKGPNLIGTDAAVNVKLDGKGADDTIGFEYTGQLWGHLTVNALGGTGDDEVYGVIEAKNLYILGTIESNGVLDAIFSGEDDDDFVNLWLGGPLKKLQVKNAKIDGGLGTDFWRENWDNGQPNYGAKIPGTSTPNVTKTGMEGFVTV